MEMRTPLSSALFRYCASFDYCITLKMSPDLLLEANPSVYCIGKNGLALPNVRLDWQDNAAVLSLNAMHFI